MPEAPISNSMPRDCCWKKLPAATEAAMERAEVMMESFIAGKREPRRNESFSGFVCRRVEEGWL